ncbi:MAG TPA: hypothetical protein VGM53_35145 [Streptosporangiaceae bacterium]|jgi:hypothetical protein
MNARTSRAAGCLDCGGLLMDRPHPNYDHIHAVDALPRQRRSDRRIVTRGYAVGMGGSLPQIWVFFRDLEPAAVFGRAGRMSTDIAGYGVYEAAAEARYDPALSVDVHTLHINLDAEVSRTDHQLQVRLIQRFAQGVREHPESSYWHVPAKSP